MNKIVDLFAGCGGLSMGFQNAGFDIVGAFEYWDIAANCYENNFNHPVFRTDLSNVHTATAQIKELEPKIIIGGPPCQDFSHSGKRIEGRRASLTGAFAEIVSEIKPRYFVMENVDRAQKSNAYADARDLFIKSGYGLTEIVLNASYCGVPQRRKRFFCIGSLGQDDGFLLDYIQEQMSQKETTLRDFFGNTLDFEYYYRHPRNYNRRGIFSIDEPAPTMRGVNRPVPQGYLGHPNDACQLNDSIRSLTTLERALIQTFPANYKWQGTKTDMEQMIGNAVPVKLAEFVANALAYHVNQCETVEVNYQDFYCWLKSSQSLSVRTERDTLSRLKRANSICELPATPDAYYVFQLEQDPDFRTLTQTVRSQLKRAVSLYADYRRDSCEQESTIAK
ncbi:MAG: DNA cytosine methyltransferase [Christensenellales bacterium]|jgi:DNA (cytosine-5)-methyltransferase 1